jgi:hypothetical protein
MKHCVQNEQPDFVCSVVSSIPFILQMKQFSAGTVFADILQPTLAISETHVPVQHSLASIVGDLTCVLAGSCVCLRLENTAVPLYPLIHYPQFTMPRKKFES